MFFKYFHKNNPICFSKPKKMTILFICAKICVNFLNAKFCYFCQISKGNVAKICNRKFSFQSTSIWNTKPAAVDRHRNLA